MMKSKNAVLGFFLILIGGIWIFTNIFDIPLFHMGNMWFLFILVPGLCFELSYFSTRRNPGLLVPGGILTVIGLLFAFEIITNWHFATMTWPIYPLAVAIGLFQLYLFGGKDRALLVPVGILTTISVVFMVGILYRSLFAWINFSWLIPGILILVGVYLIFRKH